MKISHYLFCMLLFCWLVLLCYFSYAAAEDRTSFGAHSNTRCIDHEKEALLQFKQGIESDNCGLLSSWGDIEDCCQWHGIRCSNHTGHVIMLHLQGSKDEFGFHPCLIGKLDPSLFELKHLKYLDLSYNRFYQTIPNSIESLVDLEHLNFSGAGFFGEIPPQIGNLSNLASLDLSSVFYSKNRLTAKSLQWLSHLTLLREIYLGWNDLTEATDLFQTLTKIPSLRVLYLDNCCQPPSSSLSYINSSTSLRVINLSANNFNDTSIFQWLFNLCRNGNHIEYIDLSYNLLSESLPSSFGKYMHSLIYLDLSHNNFEGPIPDTFSNLSSLEVLSLNYNNLHGPISDSLSNLRSLRTLSLSYNKLYGSISKSLNNLCNLQKLWLDHNSFVDNLSNVFQALSSGCANKPLLEYLDLSANQFWGSVPDIVSTFSSMRELHLVQNHLNGTISRGIGQLSMLEILDVSDNSLKATLNHNHFLNLSQLHKLYLSDNSALVFNIKADWIPPFQLDIIHLSSCKLGPSFPKWLLLQTNISELDISNARISGSIPAAFWLNSLSPNIMYLNLSHNKINGQLPILSTTLHDLEYVDLSSNYFEGSIPSFLGASAIILYLNDNMFSNATHLLCPKTHSYLLNLHLSNNFLSGELPDCWMKFVQLHSLHLEDNNFSGNIPTSIGSLDGLIFLILRNNSFSGELPASLKNCTALEILDIGYNSLTGYVPSGIGISFPNLGLLSLRRNKFYGRLPLSLCQMSNLQILDLAINHISGTIPKCVYNLTSMIQWSGIQMQMSVDDTVIIEWKRAQQRFKSNLELVISVDLSCNNLEGSIPDGISSLTGLISLDLSRNKLTGRIPSNIGQLTSLQLLDLSHNHLSGVIPTSLSEVSFLEILDLSDNNLSGVIPLGTQLRGFDPSSYGGNPLLCGAPLRDCTRYEAPAKTLSEENDQDEHGNNDFYLGLYISVVLGFIIGFWGVCGSLVVKRSWRHAFFRFFDDLKDKIYVMVVVNVARIRRKE